MPKLLEFDLTERQTEAYEALDDPGIVDVMYGGAKGGGKSHLLCAWVFVWCVALANLFDMQPTDKPIHVGWMGRKQATDFTATTLQTWQRIIPPDRYVLKGASEKHPKHILIEGRIAMDFGGLDRIEDVNKFNSAEYAIIAVDQAEETSKDDISVLRASRRLTIEGRPLAYKGLFTANPARCWLQPDFILNPGTRRKFIQALPADNPYLPADYIQTLKDSFGHRPELLEAYLHGNWDSFDTDNQCIKGIWVRQAMSKRAEARKYPRKVITCDPARFGDDETVIYYMEEGAIKDEAIYGEKDTMHTAGHLAVWARKYDAEVVVDEIGIGAGIVDRLNEMRIKVIGINSAAKAGNTEHWYNLRAQMWDEVGKMFSDGQVALGSDDQQLMTELCVPCYTFRNGRMLIENKDEIKKRLGSSPNRADAYVMGLWQTQSIMPTFQRGEVYQDEYDGDNKAYNPFAGMVRA